MPLRDYQERALTACRRAFRGGARGVVLVMPTGTGKTKTGVATVHRHLYGAPDGRRALWLAHRQELCEQAYDALREVGLEAGVLGDGVARASRAGANVSVAMIQTLVARDLRPEATFVVYDEVHHSAAAEYRAVVAHYEGLGVPRLGLTATPERGDGRGLGRAGWDAIITGISVAEATERGYLVPCEIERPGRRLRARTVAQRPVDAWQEYARGRRTILFAPNLESAAQFVDEFRAEGVGAEIVDGAMPTRQRVTVLEGHRGGVFPVLVNVGVLTEGYDDPAVACVILARGCGSAGLYLQMVGRGLRPAPGKTDCVVIDLLGTSHDHGLPDEPRFYSLDGKGIRRTATDDLRFCQLCGCPLDAGVTECPECGREIQGTSYVPDVVHAPLIRYARKRAEGAVERAATLARWLYDARAAGHKRGRAFMKFKGVYGDPPASDVISLASRVLRELGDEAPSKQRCEEIARALTGNT
jgi:superfamily II DNA or RNA helicase